MMNGMIAIKIFLASTLLHVTHAFLSNRHSNLIVHHRQCANVPSRRVSIDGVAHDAKSSKMTTSLFLSSAEKTKFFKDGEKEELTKEKISSIIEITFIEACIQIATGYVDVLKMFLATVRAAYEMKIPIPELVESIEIMDVQNNSANRQLMSEEIKLRTLWLEVSYLTLEYLEKMESSEGDDEGGNNEQISLTIEEDTKETYESIIENKVREFLGKDDSSENSKSVDMRSSDPAQVALMKYSLKIIDMMLVVVKEARAAGESYGVDEDGVGPPRPPIPGAFD